MARGVGMGLLAWIKRRKSTGRATSIATAPATSADLGGGDETVVRDGVEVGNPAQRRSTVDEIDHLAHEFLTAGVATAGSGGITMASSSVFIDGKAVSTDDPRARERVLEAVSKLRAQGFDEVADDLERQLGAATPPATGGPRSAASTGALPASSDDAVEASSSAGPVGDGGVDAPSAPAPPAPPSPPSGAV
jgi:hypothetical protein